jgi:hypothetical protein
MKNPDVRTITTALALTLFATACATPPPKSSPAAASRPVTSLEKESARVVDSMTAAWNAGDAETYSAYLHPNVIVQQINAAVDGPTGRDAMAKSSADFFEREPDAKIEIVSRLLDGRYVIERERMVGLKSGTTFWTTVVYEVRGQLVAHMWIIPQPPAAKPEKK